MKKAARGCPRIQIWSHEGPNQSQNHVFERSRCQPVSHGFAHPASRKARVASGLEPRHVLRKQAIFFPAKTRTLENRHAKLIKFGQSLTMIAQNLTKFEPKCSGPAFFVEIRARPKIWRLVSTKRKILRLVSTRRQVLTDIVKIGERVVRQAAPAAARAIVRTGSLSY